MNNFNDTNNKEQLNTGFNIDMEYAENLPDEAIEETPTTLVGTVFELLQMLSVAIIAAVIIFSLVFRLATISGPSMENTLFTGDKVIITNLAYTPKQGDIVVISRNVHNAVEEITASNEPIIKRVIAVGGQTVDIDFIKGVVSVDGKELDEAYIKNLTKRSYDVKFPLYVPDGYIFVLGDNRMESMDSRDSRIGEGGLIDERYVLGHAVLRIFPFDSIGWLKDE